MSRHGRMKKKADRQGFLILGGVLLIAIAGGIYFVKSKSETVQRDKDNLCRTDGIVSRETAVILDATDDFNESQALLVKKELELFLSNSLIDERFSIYAINEKLANNKPILVACNAGDGSEKSSINANLRRLKKDWEDKFYNKIFYHIDRLVGQHEAEQSPIMEFVKYVSVETFYSSKAEQKRLIIISDMLHHTNDFSHYTPDNPFFKTPYAMEVRPYLSGVKVDVLYIYRPKNSVLQNRQHIDFWEKYLTEGNGSLVRVKTVN